MGKKRAKKKGVERPGDILMDFLLVAGLLPPDFFSSPRGSLPPEARAGCRRLTQWLRNHPEAWLEVPPSMADGCCLIVDGEELPVNQLHRLPGLEHYPWHKRGPLWYCSDTQVNLMYSGPLIVMRDGWITVDPRDESQFTLLSWSGFDDHSWPGAFPDGDGEESDEVLTLDSELVWTAKDLFWVELTLEMVSALLPRLMAANDRSRGHLITPLIDEWSPELIRTIMLPEREGEIAHVQ